MKNRPPMKVDIEFEKKIKELQKKIRMKDGSNPSIRELTKNIVSVKEFKEIEKRLLEEDNSDINLKMDRRRVI